MNQKIGNVLVQVILVSVLANSQSAVATEDFLTSPVGVFDLEYEGAVVTRLKIKGEAEVTGALSPRKANRIARDKALRDAKALFSKWLKEDVTVIEQAEEIVVLAEIDGTSSASVIDASSTQFQSVSQNLLRGVTVLYEETNDGVYTVVLGWSHKLASATEDVSRQIADPKAFGSVDTTGSGNMGSSGKVKRTAKNTDDF